MSASEEDKGKKPNSFTVNVTLPPLVEPPFIELGPDLALMTGIKRVRNPSYTTILDFNGDSMNMFRPK